tara:strand:+ start:4209 stop:4835 length:627 start_codon:yes stop_codon:yes gene_type:complete
MKSDYHIILDDVDVKRNSYQYRNIFNNHNKITYLTLPIDKTYRKKICDLSFKNNTWPEEHLKSLSIYYKKTNYFDEIYSHIEPIYKIGKDMKPYEFLHETINLSMYMLELKTPLVSSKILNVDGNKGTKILNLVKKVNGEIYLSGQGAKEYLKDVNEMFLENKIKIIYDKYLHPYYIQSNNLTFIPGLSCLDLLFCQGIENARFIFKG